MRGGPNRGEREAGPEPRRSGPNRGEPKYGEKHFVYDFGAKLDAIALYHRRRLSKKQFTLFSCKEIQLVEVTNDANFAFAVYIFETCRCCVQILNVT